MIDIMDEYDRYYGYTDMMNEYDRYNGYDRYDGWIWQLDMIVQCIRQKLNR